MVCGLVRSSRQPEHTVSIRKLSESTRGALLDICSSNQHLTTLGVAPQGDICKTCWQINQGRDGDCSSVEGRTVNFCNFCTNG